MKISMIFFVLLMIPPTVSANDSGRVFFKGVISKGTCEVSYFAVSKSVKGEASLLDYCVGGESVTDQAPHESIVSKQFVTLGFYSIPQSERRKIYHEDKLDDNRLELERYFIENKGNAAKNRKIVYMVEYK